MKLKRLGQLAAVSTIALVVIPLGAGAAQACGGVTVNPCYQSKSTIYAQFYSTNYSYYKATHNGSSVGWMDYFNAYYNRLMIRSGCVPPPPP